MPFVTKAKTKWQLVLVLQSFAVRTSSEIQRFHPDQIVEVPKEKIRELTKKGLACPLIFTPDHVHVYAPNFTNPLRRSTQWN